MKLKDNYYTLYADIDTVVFRASTILEEKTIDVEYQNNGRKKNFKNITEFRGRKKTQIGGWLGEINKKRKKKKQSPFLLKDFEITPVTKIVLGNEVAYKYIIQEINKLQNLPWVKKLILLLADPINKNFRYDLYPDYKGNRPPKPLKFIEIRDYFYKLYKDQIILSGNAESDDKLAEFGWDAFLKEKDDIVLGHIDKDCDGIPGIHYNYDTGKLYEINEFQAHLNICTQCLIGDKGTDNIPGIPVVNNCMQEKFPIGLGGFGPVKAKKVLENCQTIADLYKEVEFIYKCYYNNDYKEPLSLTYKLVHLCEIKNEIKDFPFSED